jgi:replicative DNA helicase
MRQMEHEGKAMEYSEFGQRFASVHGQLGLFMIGSITSYELTLQRAELLRELSTKRKLYALCTKGMTIATDPTAGIEDFEKLLNDLRDTSASADTGEQSFSDTVKLLRQDMAGRIAGTAEQGMMTGLHIFDSHFGLHAGDLVIFAGRTSQGKSTLATTIARNMALMGTPSAYYSLEMGAKQLTARIMARDTMLSSSRMLYDKMNDGELARFDQQAATMQNLPIYYDDKSKTSFRRLTTSIRAMVRKHAIRIAFIDYLQILANGSGDNREQLIGDMARDLKRLAAELNIVIVALSQLARPSGGASKEPTLNRMRGSGQIEEACDIAVLIYRPNPKTEKANIYIAKGRNIGLGKETIKFNSSLSYFSDFEDGDPDAPYAEKKEDLPF